MKTKDSIDDGLKEFKLKITLDLELFSMLTYLAIFPTPKKEAKIRTRKT